MQLNFSAMINPPTSQSVLFENCDDVFRLIRNGREAEARKLFPMEYYLVKKYVSLGIAEFKKLMASRLQLQ